MDSAELLEDKDWRDDAALVFPDSVLNAIDELLPDTEQLDEPRFDTTDYINRLFPTEQSLSNIDSVVAKMEYKMSSIDEEIQDLVRSEVASRDDGHKSLEEARGRIRQLAVQVRDINKKAEKSEEMVREITSEIKQLDCAKTNLTAAITTLNHFHMLVGGIDTLRQLTQKHLYKEIVLPLQAVMEVMKHFETYKDIKQINDLRDEVQRIRAELAAQILADFKEAFTGTKSNVPHRTLAEACLVVSVLDRKIKNDLLKWFIGIQLQEYVHLFSPNQETAWLDKIDKRYAWLKKHLIEFERSPGGLFPPEWQLSELIAVEFCRVTKAELTGLMTLRKQEIDVKLLLYAIQKTYNFETLLDKRFTGETFESDSESCIPAQEKKSSSAVFDAEDKQAAPPQDDATKSEDTKKSPFIGLIGACFEPHLSLYIDSLDTNLSELTDRFVQDAKQSSQQDGPGQPGAVFTSCADLFLFYKKCMVQCTQLTTGRPMLDLAAVFQKYLHKYAVSVLQASLPKQAPGSLAGQVSYIGAGGLLNNLHSLLKEDECGFNKQEISRITSVITTSEYCLETTIHLEQKLKEKVAPSLADKIDLTQEQDLFHKIISNCIQILVQDLEFSCEPSLTAMAKISWQNIDSVGDQSSYINQIIVHLKSYIPTLRNNLASSRKYFTQFCIRYANSFIPKFIQNIYKCKPISTVGSEQLLLDTHMLKTVLLDLPSIGSDVKRQAPATYTKVVIKMMTKAEMILKLVMSPLDLSPGSMENFVSQLVKLLPECTMSEFHKILDMKGVKKTQLASLDAIYKDKCRLISSEGK